MTIPLRALIVEDSDDDTLLLASKLGEGGFAVDYARVETAEAMQGRLAVESWDIIFSDFTMPRFNAFEALGVLRQSGIDIPFIIVSGTIGEDRAVTAMKAGAHDYLLKGNLKRLVPAVERELREAQVRRERSRYQINIHRLAFTDSLTQLPNRARCLELIQEGIKQAQMGNYPLALLLFDIDRFKEVNDTLGHNYGDMLLLQMTSRLQRALYDKDVVARLGGDEFAILLGRLGNSDDVRLVIDKILAALDPPVMIEGLPIAVEVSIGVALFPAHATNADVLLQHADVAMYQAKRTGSVHAVYDPDQDPHSPKRLALLGELRGGIERGELVLHYQPIIGLDDGRPYSCEALVRWRHSERGLLPPGEFIGMAERTGLIRPLTEWVLQTALRQCASWQGGGRELRVAVNLSARSLNDANLPGLVAGQLRNSGVDPRLLEIEITESAIIVDPVRALETLKKLAELGVRVSLDDFGTGYSSLAVIRNLPAHEIKVDRSFVSGMTKDRSDEVIVRIVIDLARNLGLNVVAEGVEDALTQERLKQLGCHRAQGYFICHPLPAEELDTWLATH